MTSSDDDSYSFSLAPAAAHGELEDEDEEEEAGEDEGCEGEVPAPHLPAAAAAAHGRKLELAIFVPNILLYIVTLWPVRTRGRCRAISLCVARLYAASFGHYLCNRRIGGSKYKLAEFQTHDQIVVPASLAAPRGLVVAQ